MGSQSRKTGDLSSPVAFIGVDGDLLIVAGESQFRHLARATWFGHRRKEDLELKNPRRNAIEWMRRLGFLINLH